MRNIQIYKELEPFSLSLGFRFVLFCFVYFVSPLILLAISHKPRPRWKMQLDKIAVRTLDFGIPPKTSYWSILCWDLDHWFPWYATNINFPRALRSRKIFKQKLEYIYQFMYPEKDQRLVQIKRNISSECPVCLCHYNAPKYYSWQQLLFRMLKVYGSSDYLWRNFILTNFPLSGVTQY